METWYISSQLFPIFRSYPTYEEWKHPISSTTDGLLYRSYPTYEEWKPNPFMFGLDRNWGSYPTYEEWKL